MLMGLLLVSYSLAASPCDGAKVGYWINPDGTRGGYVASTAKLHAGVIIGPEAQVCGEAVVSGKTHIFGRAKISGKAKIHNALICQASLIDGFAVIDSDYYCQTEDPEPPHPGEAGKKTLLGIDIDNDGVRDDVEIWINDLHTNTANEDNRFLRMAFKQKASAYGKIVKNINDKEKHMQAVRELLDAQECVSGRIGKVDKSKRKDREYLMTTEAERKKLDDKETDLMLEIYNTKDRLAIFHKSSQLMHGEELRRAGKGKDGCYFEKR